MQKQPFSKIKLEYRHYNLSVDFPAFALLLHQFAFPNKNTVGIDYMHLHNCIEIGYCYSGRGYLMLENQSIPYDDDCVVIVPPFATHITYQDEEMAKEHPEIVVSEYFYMDTEKLLSEFFPSGLPLLDYFQHNSANFPSVLSKKDYPVITQLVKLILDVMRNEQPNYQNEVRGLVTALMIELDRTFADEVHKGITTPQSQLVLKLSPAIEFINEHYMEHIAPLQLAELCHMSLTHFRRMFKSTMGNVPLDYIQRVRVQKAQELLYSTENSILDISLEVGFESISSFNRYFTKFADTTPSKWRKDIRSIRKKKLQYSEFDFSLK